MKERTKSAEHEHTGSGPSVPDATITLEYLRRLSDSVGRAVVRSEEQYGKPLRRVLRDIQIFGERQSDALDRIGRAVQVFDRQATEVVERASRSLQNWERYTVRHCQSGQPSHVTRTEYLAIEAEREEELAALEMRAREEVLGLLLD